MKRFTLLLAALAAALPAVAVQDKAPQETRDVRIYLLDRVTPERPLRDAAAMLTLQRASGRGETFLFPRAVDEPAPAAEGAGLIRGLVSTPYFVELNLGDGAPAAKGADDATTPSPQDVLRRARKGTVFSRKMPAAAFSEPFTATVTIRIGDATYTSEEFQGPRPGRETTEDVTSRIDRTLDAIRDRTKDSPRFMDLKPAVDEFARDLTKLAPAGFSDATGAVEIDRQWCLAHARAMEEACAKGQPDTVGQLSLECGPRLKRLQSALAPARPKEPEPVPTPGETPPTVK